LEDDFVISVESLPLDENIYFIFCGTANGLLVSFYFDVDNPTSSECAFNF